MELNEIISKERDIFRNTSWYPILKTFIESKDFEEPFVYLAHEINEGRHFGPPLSKIFRAFEITDCNTSKAIVIKDYEDDSELIYHNGVAFDNDPKIFSEILREETGKNIKPEDLCKNGVLLIDKQLTHDECNKDIWNKFITFLKGMVSCECLIIKKKDEITKLKKFINVLNNNKKK